MVKQPYSAEAREAILEQVRAYCREPDRLHQVDEGRIPYAGRVFDEEEVVNLIDSALEFWLTGGRYTERFEKDLAAFLGVPYCIAACNAIFP